ncbi:MAG TPA: glycosyltransferase family 2 protein [Candidatus Saccharimonadales bacterium]|nr:glycosyltransferase family 2 protein [Candidatus Saccharimonadales bacterium]
MPKLKVSVVIPVYNEADAIIPCLDALAAQTVPADEIIVVDNASTDGTGNILADYAKTHAITILNEPKSGVVFARTTGFDAATGDVIGRIDADTHVSPSWVAELHRIFAHEPIVATTGAVRYYDLPAFFNRVDRVLRALTVVKKEDATFLNGSNMAIRATAWRQIRDTLCLRNGVHEDLDIAVHLRRAGQKVFYAPRLVVAVSARRLDDSFKDIYTYAMGNIRTYKVHHIKRLHSSVFIASLLILTHLPLRAIHRGYNPRTKQLSLTKMLFARPAPRKSPLS